MREIVLGASGFLGLNLVLELCRRSRPPLCPYRGRIPRRALRATAAECVAGDLDDRASLVEAMRGAHTVYHFAAHYPRLSLDRDGSLSTAMRQLENVLDAAARVGAARLVYVSTIATVRAVSRGRPGTLSTEADAYDAAPGFGVYHDIKWLMERRVLDEDRFERTALCPGACLGPWDHRIGTSMMLVALARGLTVAHPDGWVNVTDARDVAEVAIETAQLPRMPDRLIVAGSNRRLHELLGELARRYGVAPPPPPLPAPLAIEQADAAERAAADTGTRAAMSRELVDMAIHGVPVDTTLATRLTGHRFRTLEETLSGFEQWARPRNIIP